MSQIFPRRQCLDKSRCCCSCVERWSAGAGCCVFTLSHFFIVQLVTCELRFSQLAIKFPCTVHCQTSKTTVALPGLSRCLPAPSPPSTPTPSNSNPAAKGTPPKFWKKASDGGCFCVVHSLLLPLFMCPLLVNDSTFKSFFSKFPRLNKC